MDTQTYAEAELLPLGFKLARKTFSKKGSLEVQRMELRIGQITLVFDCICPNTRGVSTLCCPLHFCGGATDRCLSVEQAKLIPLCFK